MELVAEKKASRIVLLDLSGVSLIADYFVICTVESARQLQAIVEIVSEHKQELGRSLVRTEGTPDSGWILMDFSSVILHAFNQEQRAYYQLEDLWSHARVLTVIP
ncbi:MAG: ribosome silencing factor [Chloroflexia bacterium]|nr:ribosome silencing factor [Chloroflexia bacterium]